MDSLSILWQVGILVAVLVFGFKIGLASGLANFSKKALLVIVAIYGIGVLVITKLSAFYSQEIIEFIYSYNTVFFLIMATIMITAGVLTIREWKIHQKNTSASMALVVLAPCPCCFLSIIVSILLVSSTIGLGAFDISQYVALALVLTIIISYFASRFIVKIIKKPFPIVLGNFMLFLGVYFLISSLVVPNIIGILGKSMGELSIENVYSLLLVILLIFILLVVGIVVSKKNSILSK